MFSVDEQTLVHSFSSHYSVKDVPQRIGATDRGDTFLQIQPQAPSISVQSHKFFINLCTHQCYAIPPSTGREDIISHVIKPPTPLGWLKSLYFCMLTWGWVCITWSILWYEYAIKLIGYIAHPQGQISYQIPGWYSYPCTGVDQLILTVACVAICWWPWGVKICWLQNRPWPNTIVTTLSFFWIHLSLCVLVRNKFGNWQSYHNSFGLWSVLQFTLIKGGCISLALEILSKLTYETTWSA